MAHGESSANISVSIKVVEGSFGHSLYVEEDLYDDVLIPSGVDPQEAADLVADIVGELNSLAELYGQLPEEWT